MRQKIKTLCRIHHDGRDYRVVRGFFGIDQTWWTQALLSLDNIGHQGIIANPHDKNKFTKNLFSIRQVNMFSIVPKRI